MAKLPLLSNLIIISQFHYPFFVPNMNFKRKHLFKMEMFCNIIHFFIVIIDQCNASLLDKKSLTDAKALNVSVHRYRYIDLFVNQFI